MRADRALPQPVLRHTISRQCSNGRRETVLLQRLRRNMIFVSYLLSFSIVSADIKYDGADAEYDPSSSDTIFRLFNSEMERPAQMIKEFTSLVKFGQLSLNDTDKIRVHLYSQLSSNVNSFDLTCWHGMLLENDKNFWAYVPNNAWVNSQISSSVNTNFYRGNRSYGFAWEENDLGYASQCKGIANSCVRNYLYGTEAQKIQPAIFTYQWNTRSIGKQNIGWYSKGKETSQWVIDDPWAGELVIRGVTPLYSPTGRFLGIMNTGVSMTSIENMLVTNAKDGSTIYIIGQKSKKIMASTITGASGNFVDDWTFDFSNISNVNSTIIRDSAQLLENEWGLDIPTVNPFLWKGYWVTVKRTNETGTNADNVMRFEDPMLFVFLQLACNSDFLIFKENYDVHEDEDGQDVHEDEDEQDVHEDEDGHRLLYEDEDEQDVHEDEDGHGIVEDVNSLGDCKPCPSGAASCDEVQLLKDLLPEKGYYRFNEKSLKFYKCRNYVRHGDAADKACSSTGCAHHSAGPLCALCEPDYFRDSNGRCRSCRVEKVLMALLGIIIAFFGFIFCLYGIIRHFGGIHKVFELVKPRWLKIGWWGISARIVFYQCQIIWEFTNINGIAWPNPYRTLVQMMASLSFNLLDLVPPISGCVKFNHFIYLLIWTILPLLITSFALLVAFYTDTDNKTVKERLLRSITRISKGFVDIISLVHTVICLVIFETFRCYEFDSGEDKPEKYLSSDLSRKCEGDLYNSYKNYAICMAVIYVMIIPALIVFKRRRDIYKMDEKHSNYFFAHSFRPKFYWFDVVDLYYRLCMTAFCIVWFPDSTKYRAIFSVVVALSYLALVAFLRPYARESHNLVAGLCQFMLVLVIMSGVASVVSDDSRIRKESFGWFLTSVNLGVLFVLAIFSRNEKLHNVIDCLLRDDPVAYQTFCEDFAILYGSDNTMMKINLADAVLLCLHTCLKSVATKENSESEWKFICNVLFALQDGKSGSLWDTDAPATTIGKDLMEPDMDDGFTKTEREATRGIEAHNSLHDISIHSQDSKIKEAIESDENVFTTERRWTSMWYDGERADTLYPHKDIPNTQSKTRMSTIDTNYSAEMVAQNLIAGVKRRSFIVGGTQRKSIRRTRRTMPPAALSGDVEMLVVGSNPLVGEQSLKDTPSLGGEDEDRQNVDDIERDDNSSITDGSIDSKGYRNLFDICRLLSGSAHRTVLIKQASTTKWLLESDPVSASRVRALEYVDKGKIVRQNLSETLKSGIGELSRSKRHHNVMDAEIFPALLRGVASGVEDEFRNALLNTVQDSELLEDTAATKRNVRVALVMGPTKAISRMAAKVESYRTVKRKEEWPFSCLISDILRGTFVCESTEDLLRVYDNLKDSNTFELIRMKNKMNDMKAPYNIHLNFFYHPPMIKNAIVCEIQLFVKSIYNLQRRQHKLYELVRAANVSIFRREYLRDT